MTKRRKPTQADLVLQMLRERGGRGVHTFEIYDVHIMNPSQRIAELEKRGHVIHPERERFKPDHAIGARYTLVRDAGSAGGDDSDAPSVGGPTDLTDTPVSDWEAADGHILPTQATAPSEQDRLASARVDTPGGLAAPEIAGHLFPDTIVELTTRPHWMDV